MWLRRQDELNERHGTERFTTAIRVLSRRPSVLARRYEAAMTAELRAGEPRESWTLIRRDRQRALDRAERRERARERRLERKRRRDEAALRIKPRSTLLARRRRVVSVLFLTFTVGSALTGVFGAAWVALPAASGALLSLYIGHLRVQDRRRLEAKLRRRLRPGGSASRAEAAAESRDPATPAVARNQPPNRATPSAPRDPYDGEPPGPQPARDGWQPVPVPLPTYVTAPVAPKPRTQPQTSRAASAGSAAGAPTGERPAERPAERSAETARADGARDRRGQRERRGPRERTPLFDQYAVDEPEHRLAAGE